MATYATYRHIELDKVGYSKKRVRNPSSEIFNVLCSPPNNAKVNTSGHVTPRRASQHNDSFTRLFGSPETKKISPRRGSLTKQDVTNRNPVTGNGVDSWDCRRNTPKVHTERNPVTGEVYTIVSPATTPTKPVQNGFAHMNGNKTPKKSGSSTPVAAKQAAEPMQNGNTEPVKNGHASAPSVNGN